MMVTHTGCPNQQLAIDCMQRIYRGLKRVGVLGACALGNAQCGEEEPLNVHEVESNASGGGGSLEGSGGSPAQDPIVDPLPRGDGALGTACDSNADCTDVYPACASVDSGVWGPGGPSLGYCTRACDLERAEEGDDDCASIDANSACRQLRPEGGGYCILGCDRGTAVNPESKCQGRTELACVTLDLETGTGECLPNCGIGLDCPEPWNRWHAI